MMPGVPTTPRVLLEKLIEDCDKIQDLVVVVANKDGDTEVFNTQMTKGQAVWLRYRFKRIFKP